MRLITSLFCLSLLVGCRTDAAQAPAQPALQPASQSASQSATQSAPGDTLARIRALAAAPACSDDSQCRSLALGATPCGGPEGFLPWSAARMPPDEIEALGKIYAAERRRAHAASGRVSTCRVLLDPGAECRAGTCELKPGTLPAR